ncbi:hypothetical protein C7H19_21835 [Aphanothece hegewaldii CCALA 016]|uniref:Uncharacterized protein n=1 Tax=Aphanothece hegewaldii CCALA 016 TaxID=2107694 RepID=A0A2T1LS62_9CHRO|nr:hypothetical protein [Aphanothece hegewaldii]PSF32273.1 hypothetical protein C7H19_21835 [Aphanothece hegewaldii CCALA 016]
MSQRLSPLKIKQSLDTVIQQAILTEPLLAKRLRDLKKWIATKKDGLLMSKVQVLDLLTEIILDSELWLNLIQLSIDERQQVLDEELSSAEKFWIDVLFPSWFRENDPHSPIWKQKIMAGEFNQNDVFLINYLQQDLKELGGDSLWRYILDLSMATDLVVVGNQKLPICIQLTTLAGEGLTKKKENWQNIQAYWNIKRALLVSYYPKGLCYKSLAKIILNDSDTLPAICYIKRSV